MNLLYPDGKINAIYFPPGLPERGGSCAFASMRCLVNCVSYLTHNSVTEETFNAFNKFNSKKLINLLWAQIESQPVKIMEWFCWGDCPPELTDKVINVIKGLSSKGVVQCGFTRNKKLWKSVLEVKNTRIGITTEDIEDLAKFAEKGLVAYPIYDTGETKLFYKTEKMSSGGSCGTNFYYDAAKQISYEADCMTCYKNKIGCFTEFIENRKP